MAVVVIVGILAVVGITMMRKYVFSSKSVEATAMIESIRAGQERWRSENQSYLDVSTAIDEWYPQVEFGAQPGATYYSWGVANDAVGLRWRMLNVTASDKVQFGYATKAGTAFTAVTPLTMRNPPTWPTANGPWYVIQAWGDVDENGIPSMYAAASFNGEVAVQNEGE